MPSLTPPVAAKDRAAVERFLEQDAVSTAVVWNRAFDMEGTKELFADGDPVRGVLAVARPEWAGGAAGIAMHATAPEAAQGLMTAWPHGEVFFHLTEEWMLSLVEPHAESIDGGVFWLFRLDPDDLVDRGSQGVEPLDPKWAELVGRVWDPDWSDAGAYVRKRIEAGHAFAVYDAGKPVAWAFTHFETPRVSMMGFLHVLEPHRRKGYARAVASALIRDILDRGKIPALHVKTDNVASLELTASLGFHRVKKQVWADAVMR
ncbi:MAG TPA: GNAT family N-acetyltransferase [Thermoplasmata archaeon]|nr:GNAT family N-acetyltransferase [Thermoplasmata archaeon]